MLVSANTSMWIRLGGERTATREGGGWVGVPFFITFIRASFIVHVVKISLFFSLSIFPALFILFFVLSFVLVVVR